jgi:AraC-like DNA-binding protein
MKYIDRAIQLYEDAGMEELAVRKKEGRAKALAGIGDYKTAVEVYQEVIRKTEEFNCSKHYAQINELHTLLGLDKAMLEAERRQATIRQLRLTATILSVIAVAILLIALLTLWSRKKIAGKNRTLAGQIRELQHEQENRIRQLLQKTTFLTPESDADELCPESRKDKICLSLRDLLLKDKIYRDEQLSRDSLTERLGINRYDLEEAFMFCFNMQYAEYISLLRLNDSIILLEESDLSMEEISEKVGYGTLRTFQRQFQAKYSMPPKEYRKLAIEKKPTLTGGV